MRNLTLITAPGTEPLTQAEAQDYLRIDELTIAGADRLNAMIKAARIYCEEFQHRAYITQTWELSLPRFRECIEVPKGKLQSVTSFKYKKSDGAETALAENTGYIVSTRGITGRITPPYGVSFPTATLWPVDPIVIRFVCGYGDTADDVPETVKQAMLMLIAHWYENRAAVGNAGAEIAFAVKALLSQDRIPIV